MPKAMLSLGCLILLASCRWGFDPHAPDAGPDAFDGTGDAADAGGDLVVDTQNRPPELISIPDQPGVLEGTPMDPVDADDLSGGDTDADGDAIFYTCLQADDLPCTNLPGASFDSATGQLTWTPDYAAAGEHTFRITGTDGANMDEVGFTVTVLENEFRVNETVELHQIYGFWTGLNNGNLVALWTSGTGEEGSTDVFGRIFTPGGMPLTGDFPLNTTTADTQRFPSGTVLQNGNLVTLWESTGQDGDGRGMILRIFDPFGEPLTGEIQANTTVSGHQAHKSYAWSNAREGGSALATLLDGNFVAVWSSENQDGSGYGVFGQIFEPDGTKLGGEFQVNSYTTDNQDAGQVVALDDGNFLALWASWDQDGDNAGVYARILQPDGTGAGGEFQANIYTSSFQTHSRATQLQNGNIVIAWHSDGQDDSECGVYLRIWTSSGAALGGEIQVNSTTIDNQRDALPLAFQDGSFLVAFENIDPVDTGYDIHAQRFDPDGQRLSEEYRLNLTTAGGQANPFGLAIGDFYLVSWDSIGQDGDGSGIYGTILPIE